MVESEASCYMHYESEGVDFVLPSELCHNVNLIGENSNSLPHNERKENQIFDRAKKFC